MENEKKSEPASLPEYSRWSGMAAIIFTALLIFDLACAWWLERAGQEHVGDAIMIAVVLAALAILFAVRSLLSAIRLEDDRDERLNRLDSRLDSFVTATRNALRSSPDFMSEYGYGDLERMQLAGGHVSDLTAYLRQQIKKQATFRREEVGRDVTAIVREAGRLWVLTEDLRRLYRIADHLSRELGRLDPESEIDKSTAYKACAEMARKLLDLQSAFDRTANVRKVLMRWVVENYLDELVGEWRYPETVKNRLEELGIERRFFAGVLLIRMLPTVRQLAEDRGCGDITVRDRVRALLMHGLVPFEPLADHEREAIEEADAPPATN